MALSRKARVRIVSQILEKAQERELVSLKGRDADSVAQEIVDEVNISKFINEELSPSIRYDKSSTTKVLRLGDKKRKVSFRKKVAS